MNGTRYAGPAGSRRVGALLAMALGALACALAAGCGTSAGPAQDPSGDWQADWAVEESFQLSIDTEGYSLPTAIAFVPNPGSRPDDPLYFVTELRGTVKVVTNDRTVHEFARVRTLQPPREAPAGAGQAGLAGICLDPRNGYVFVTYSYEDSNTILRNNIVRFESEPGTFGLEPTGDRAFTDVFAPFQAGTAHQIGACQVVGDSLFASVGDGWNAAASQQLDQLLGKILRLTLDGEPFPGNPFAGEDGARRYVWAYGLRNPFGLKAVDGDLYATHNGPAVDSFLQIERGRNYRWDGSDWSIGVGVEASFAPSFSPVQLDLYSREMGLFPRRYRDTFFFAVTGSDPYTSEPGETKAGIVRVPYAFGQRRVREVPSYFLEYRGSGQQLVVGLAFGPDGLYFAPLLPNADGLSAVFKVSHAPDSPHPHVIGRGVGAAALMAEKGCFSCHQLAGQGASVGPNLDSLGLLKRLQDRLNAPGYAESVQELRGEEFEDERREVLEAEGRERIRVWVKNKILSPEFDNPSSQMPDLGLTPEEAERITTYLVGEERGGIRRWARNLLGNVFGETISPEEGTVLGFFAGLVAAAAAFLLATLVRWRLRRRRSA